MFMDGTPVIRGLIDELFLDLFGEKPEQEV